MGEDRQGGRVQVSGRSLSTSVVRVRPDVTALDQTFLYSVPADFGVLAVGTMVRIPLSGRRVNGWVAENISDPPERNLSEILAVRSIGPSEEILDLADWAAWRWAGNPVAFIDAASPEKNIKQIDDHSSSVAPQINAEVSKYFDNGPVLLRIPPAGKKISLIEYAVSNYETPIVIFPTYAQARAAAKSVAGLGRRISVYPDDWSIIRAGGVPIFGTRSAAWAPCPKIDAALVIDAHDHRYKEERSPTWNAIDVLIERTRRSNAPTVLVSATPTPVLESLAKSIEVARAEEREGWPEARVIDLRSTDPRLGLLTEEVTKVLRADRRVLLVLNRKGYATLLVCTSCGAAASCERCGARMGQKESVLVCSSCTHTRPVICQECNSQKLKLARMGVSRLKDDVVALIGDDIDEITKDSTQEITNRVAIGTEAVLYRSSGNVDDVVFLDFDQEILAPFVGAFSRSIAMVARAGRLVGRRGKGGRVFVQTRHPENAVIQAAEFGDPTRVVTAERKTLEQLELPPFCAAAHISGPVSDEYVSLLTGRLRVDGPDDGKYLVRAESTAQLCDALSSVKRPTGKMRIDVDPMYF